MSSLKYINEIFMSDSPFLDILIHDLKVLAFSSVVKDEYLADKNETMESLKKAQVYIACIERHASIYAFDDIISRDVLEKANVPEEYIRRYFSQIYTNKNQSVADTLSATSEDVYAVSTIPKEYHKAIIELMMPYYIDRYEEENNYYRTLIGLPPYKDPGVAIRDYEYLIPDYIEYDGVYFHEVGYKVNKEFEALGILDVVRADYPEYEYLNYLTQGVDLYKARTKMDFQIIWNTEQVNTVLIQEFLERYERNRDYVLTGLYTKAMELESAYYHSFMLAYTMLITVIDIIAEMQSHIIKKDILDKRCVKYIFSMYGVPYYKIIPYKYQERLCKNIHKIIKNKSTDQGFIDLINLFGFEDLEVWKWFILKNKALNTWSEFKYDFESVLVSYQNTKVYHDTVIEALEDDITDIDVPHDYEYISKYYQTLTLDRSEDRCVPFPFSYFLEKGNAMIVSLDGKILIDDEDYRIHDYNKIQFLNETILNNKTNLRYDFFYDVDTMGDEFLTITNKALHIYHTKEYENVIDQYSSFDLSNTELSRFFSNTKNQFNIIHNGRWLEEDEYTIDRTNRIITFDESIELDKLHDDIDFLFLQSSLFDTLYKKEEVTGSSSTTISIPQPFVSYTVKENEFFITIDNEYVDDEEYTVSANTITFTDTTLNLTNKVIGFHFFYSNKSLDATPVIRETVVTLKTKEPYQTELHTDFPISHYVESGYKVFVKTLDWWLPSSFFDVLGSNTIALSDHAIASKESGREYEVHFVYMPYDRTVYKNLGVTSSYIVATKDFQKTFTIDLPFNNYFSLGNLMVVDMEGVYLKRNNEDQGYTMSTTTSTVTITITNRDVRPMNGQRVNFTFYYQITPQREYQVGVDIKSLGVFDSDNKVFELPYPFYPYLQTTHSFLIQIGQKIYDMENIEMVDNFHFRLTRLPPEDFKYTKDKEITVLFFYNKWYTDHPTQRFTIEWKRQNVYDYSMIIDPPSENYIENGWPYMIAYGDKQLLDIELYNVYNHVLYTNPVTDLEENTYGTYLDFIYVYLIKNGYIEEQYVEKDYSLSTDMYFVRTNIKNIHHVENVKDKSKWKSYDFITRLDEWWDGKYYIHDAHNYIKNNIYIEKFNYERSKYYQVAPVVNLTEYCSHINYLYSMLYDDVLLEELIDIPVPILSSCHRFKLAHLFIYMTVITYVYNEYEDFIIDKPSQYMWINGFNFTADLEELKTYLKENKQCLSDFPIWNFITPSSQVEDLVKFVNIYKTNMSVKDTILRHMVEANDFKEYILWKKIYDSLLLTHINMTYFTKSNEEVAKTYTEFLEDKDQVLYKSIIRIKSIVDKESQKDEILNTIDSIIYILEEYINGEECSKLFSIYSGRSEYYAARYLHVWLDFFKSYKITLLPISEVLNTADGTDPDNYFKPIDGIHHINETVLQGDYMIPKEDITNTERMQLHEWIEVDTDDLSQVADHPYQSHSAKYEQEEEDIYGNTRAIPTSQLESVSTMRKPEYSSIPTITIIKDTGNWMQEDFIIRKLDKGMLEKYINPCRISIDRLYEYIDDDGFQNLPFNLNSEFEYEEDIVERDIISGQLRFNSGNYQVSLVGRVRELSQSYKRALLLGKVKLVE